MFTKVKKKHITGNRNRNRKFTRAKFFLPLKSSP
ncbi:protein of unknown function [Shinella sp. WSC3-e]|nr:hypothetical protein SHINE37_41212 [Rhizobiaceae bacterium]CAK7255850.1 protein of unknown function [Shinella sp. WSC3-e]